MTDDIFNKIDKDKLEKTVELLKSKLGPAEAAKVDATLADADKLNKLASGLSQKEKDAVVRMINNPAAMKALLSSPKVAELVRQFVSKNGGQR